MKRLLLLSFLLLFTLAGFAQLSPVSADLGFSNARIEDLSGTLIDANAISYNQVLKIKVNVHNFSDDAAPAGHFRIKIGLGSGFVVNPGFVLASAPLNAYFSWTFDGSGAQPQIVGNSIADLPADFVGTASFEVKAATPGTSTVSYNFLIANPPNTQTPLSDPIPSNNSAANGYTIAQQLSFTQVTQNVTCNGAANGSVSITPAGGIPNYSFTLANTTTNTTGTASSATPVNFTNLAPGNYNITVQDSYGNTATGTTAITQPAALAVGTITQSTVTCNGGTATVTVPASGGTAPVSYTFNNQTNQTGVFTGVTAGTYAYSVTDANSCGPVTGNFTVVQPAVIAVSSVSQTTILCNGGTATVTISANGGTAPLYYTFNGNTNQTGIFAGVTAGTYGYSVTDANTCTPATGNFTVSQPPPFVFNNIAQSTIVCNGGTATVTVSASGGTGTISYTFNGVTNATGIFNGVPAGTYSYSVKDANNCGPINGTFTVTQPAAVMVNSVLQTTILCNGGKATVTFSASGGTGSLYYTFNGVTQTANSFANISAGSYNYSVTDANNCNAVSGTFTVMQPAAVAVSNVSQTTILCKGEMATITITASGGTGSLSYTFNNVTNGTGQFTNVPAGTYNYSVTDGNGCGPVSSTFTVTEPTAISVSNVSQTAILCNGGSATVTVTANGGTGSLSYTFNGSTNQTGVFTNVAAGGPYNYSVTDANSCAAAAGTFTVTQPTAISFGTVTKTNNACNGGSNGSITVPVSGGTPGYAFTLSGPTMNTTGATSGVFTGLAAGTYNVTVKDANNCTATVFNIAIAQPSGTVPDMTVSVADYTDNFFPANAAEITLIYQLNEIGGNPSLNDILRISKQADYQISMVTASSVTISGTTYALDNSRWTANDSDPDFYRVSLNNGLQIGCGQSVYLAVKLKRATVNKSIFSLTSVVRNVTNETNSNNNTTIVVLVGQ